MTPVVRSLLIANVAAFFLQSALPGLESLFMFIPRAVLFRPWTPVTYMFLHGGLMHLLFNMLGLYFFGSRVEERLGARPFLILYFLSGLSGALLSSLFAPAAPIIGASAGVFGVMLAFAYFWPHAIIHIYGIIPVPARVLVIITTALTLWNGLAGGRSGIAHFAHLGGYVGAYLYLKWVERNRGAFKRKVEAAPPITAARVLDLRTIDLTSAHELNREEVNRILDKVNAEGIGSLTPQERIFLSNFMPADDRPSPLH